MARVVPYGIAVMAHVAMRAGDVPATPTILETRAVIGEGLCAAKGGHAVGIRVHRCHHQAGNAQSAGTLMALDADVAAVEPGWIGLLVEAVKHDALLGIQRGYFQKIRTSYVADCYV